MPASGFSIRVEYAAVESGTARQLPTTVCASFANNRISAGSGIPLITTGTAWTSEPLVAATVSVKGDAGALDASATVIVAVPPPMTEEGPKVTVTPAGAPLALSATGAANGPCARIPTESVPLPPGAIWALAGATLTLKSGGRRPYTATALSCVAM